MQKLFLLFYFSTNIFHFSIAQLQPVGRWREHLSYNQAKRVAATKNGIFCATPYSLFKVDVSDNSIERYSKVNGLHEVGVQTIQWDDPAEKLIIAYNNSNIDVLANGRLFNIDAIQQTSIVGDKTIYNIFCYKDIAYVSTGLGVILLDEQKYEVKDRYILGSSGNTVKVTGFTTDGSFFFAATQEGLKRAPISAVNLADYRNWELLSGNNGLSTGASRDVIYVQNKIVSLQNDSLFVLNGGIWTLLYGDGWNIINITVAESRILVCEQKGSVARVLVLGMGGTVETSLQNDLLLSPRQGLIFRSNIWVADSISGLLEFSGNNLQRYQPNSPLSIATGAMQGQKGIVWAASGSVTSAWTNTFTKNGLYQFTGNEWLNYNRSNIPALDTLYDLITLAADPRNTSVWAGSFGGGLLQLKTDKTIQIFKQNSSLSASRNDPSKFFISGLAFDRDNNLWIADFSAAENLAVLKADGSWKSFSVPFILNNNALSQIIIDDYNQKWIVSPLGDGLICFNHGQTIDNPADDKWKLYTSGKGAGNLPDNKVLCIARDRNSFIWVGTQKGIGIIQCPQQVFSTTGCDAILPIVQQDNFAGYLFRDEQVQSIAVDGADRKWIGTKNGAWLISAEGDKTIFRFTQSNSPLLGNDIGKITIDEITGEVFFATSNGICSFRSTATQGSTTNSQVLVFPNPVPPGYSGHIAIRGLVENAIVKITELDGRLVYQTRALGGQAIWNGKNYKGGTISTGVYLVLVSDDARQEKIATKIVFISK